MGVPFELSWSIRRGYNLDAFRRSYCRRRYPEQFQETAPICFHFSPSGTTPKPPQPPAASRVETETRSPGQLEACSMVRNLGPSDWAMERKYPLPHRCSACKPDWWLPVVRPHHLQSWRCPAPWKTDREPAKDSSVRVGLGIEGAARGVVSVHRPPPIIRSVAIPAIPINQP